MDLSRMCPKYEASVDILGKRWTCLIIRVLLGGPKRFKEIIEQIPCMSDKMLTGTKGVGTTRETNNTGNTRGMYDPKTGNQSPDPNEVATGNNSYYTETSPDNLSHLLKQTIAKKLRNKKPQLLEVYITANRGFVNQMSIYQVEAQKGVNLNGYLTDFNKLVIKHFGSDNY